MRMWKRCFVVEGLNIERFIRCAAEKGISLTGLQRTGSRVLRASAPENLFPALEQAAEEGGWQFKRGDRIGAGRALDTAIRRWPLIAVFVLAALLLFVSTRFMWAIEVIDAGVYSADVREVLEGMGIEPPMLRKRVDPELVQSALEWRYPQVAWIECGWRGTTLVIRMVEGNLVSEEEEALQGTDIVACRSGVVVSVVTASGTPVVAPGDVVQEGQVLIKGEERTSGDETRSVAADGQVMARVWDAAQVQSSLFGVSTEYTGRTETTQTVICPWFPLWRAAPSEFEHYDSSVTTIPLGGFYLPLQLRKETRYETVLSEEPLDLQQLIDEGSAAAVQKLRQSAASEESFVDIWVNWSIIDNEILLSEAIGERLMDIAQQESCSGMAATER